MRNHEFSIPDSKIPVACSLLHLGSSDWEVLRIVALENTISIGLDGFKDHVFSSTDEGDDLIFGESDVTVIVFKKERSSSKEVIVLIDSTDNSVNVTHFVRGDDD